MRRDFATSTIPSSTQHAAVRLHRCSVEDLKGGDAQLNASILRDVFAGQRGPVADALNLNAGVALASCQVCAHSCWALKEASRQLRTQLANRGGYMGPLGDLAPGSQPGLSGHQAHGTSVYHPQDALFGQTDLKDRPAWPN